MVTLIDSDPVGLPAIVTREQAGAAGLTRGQVQHRVASGRWIRLRPGYYLRTEAAPMPKDPFEQQRLEHVHRATAAGLHFPSAAISHESAALVHGMSLLDPPPDRVQLTVPPGAWTGNRVGVRLRAGRVDPSELMSGVPAVTSPARTWADLARDGGLTRALVAGDAALRRRLFGRDDLEVVAKRLGHARGSRTIALAIPLLDPRRESPLESRSFGCFIEWKLPLPELQVVITIDGEFIARVDFLWRQARVVGEADGALKYRGGGDLVAEKRREELMTDDGYRVVRWMTEDLIRRPNVVRDRLERALLGER